MTSRAERLFSVELAPAALKAFQRLPAPERERIRAALLKVARDAARPGARGSKAIKSIQGVRDDFWRLRVGDYRVMYDLIRPDRVVLVLGIVGRAELEGWLRRR